MAEFVLDRIISSGCSRAASARMHPIPMSLANKAPVRKRKKLKQDHAIILKSNPNKRLRFFKIIEVFFTVCRRQFTGPSPNRR
ncbi:MAG: hypothetical protein WD070_00665, partial [Pirellulaceae bacterium]